MHFWGGVLVALGVTTLATLKILYIRPNLKSVLLILFIAMISWEIFERMAGLYSADTYVFDTAKDMLMGLLGGLTGYFLLHKYNKKI